MDEKGGGFKPARRPHETRSQGSQSKRPEPPDRGRAYFDSLPMPPVVRLKRALAPRLSEGEDV